MSGAARATGSASTSAEPTPTSCCSTQHGGDLLVEKVSSTPKNPALGVLNGLGKIHRPRRRARRDRVLRPRHHHHHQRAAGDARRQGRPARSPRAIARCRRCRTRRATATCSTISIPSRSRSRRKASPAKSPSAPTMPATCSLPLDRDAVRQAARELKAAKRRLDRGLLPVLLHEPGARGDHARRSSSRNIPASRCRCRARCCRASANGRGCRRRCSTPISSRCWCATSTTSTAGSTTPGSAPSSAS